MAKRKVRRRVRVILGEEPIALVWCELLKPIPVPPKDVHRAAGKGRLRSRHHWLFYVGAVVFCFVVVPFILIDMLGKKIDRLLLNREPGRRARRSREGRERQGSGRVERGSAVGGESESDSADSGVFDGDWGLTAGRLLLRWYSDSPSPRRLVMLTPDRLCVAASPRRRLSPTRADDFDTVAEFQLDQARVEGEAGQPRGFATFRLRFQDGSWLELGRLAEPDDADQFLRTVSGVSGVSG
ncbi:hypothetical protein [Streptomyces kanamyceticus]|uniref:Uncharacterized protein n=1 Tax=Streptomyces kanamyceticus TaxID=1967 RepID=A0A5J6GRA0_STRKN|nr:hypothetical protein [Streptomyces kanamyceticus]QEU97553.1 hypothetical protein CP970_25060 [Streptomyces kanamyceticus]